MSYILDALKKADAQRERDPARGIHAQPAPLAPPRRSLEGPSSWVWAAAAALVVLVAGGTWLVAQERSDAPAPAAAQRAAAPAPAAPGARAFPAVAPPPVLAQAAPPPAPVAAAVLPPPQTAPAAAVLPRPQPARAAAGDEEGDAVRSRRRQRVAHVPAAGPATSASLAAAAAATAAPQPAPGAASVARASRGAATAAPAPAAETAPIAAGLPPDAPKLAISGGVYSASRAQRMLIVNGQVVNEGADLGGGVVLDEIKPKSAVLRFRGGRYMVGF